MGGKPARNVDAATSEASCICPGTLTGLRIFLPGPRRNRIWREAGYRYARGQIPAGESQPSRRGGPSSLSSTGPIVSCCGRPRVASGNDTHCALRTARSGTACHCKRDSASNGFGASSGTWRRPRRYADEGDATNNFSPGLWTCATLYAAVGLIGIFFVASRPSIATSSDGYGIVAIAPPPTLR
jgi:hypothetical protein